MNKQPLNFDLGSNICGIINKTEPFFGYLLGVIIIKIDDFPNFPIAACNHNTIYFQKSYIDEIQNDSSRLNEFICVALHEIYHVYLCHSWRYGFQNKHLYNKYKDKASWLQPLINMVLDAIINTNIKVAGYKFGQLESNSIFLHSLLDKNHPRINDNSWNEDELLLEVLTYSKFKEQSLKGVDEKGKEVEIGSSCEITFPSGKTVNTSEINMDVIFSNNPIKDFDSEEIKDLAKKAAKFLRENGKSAGKLSDNLLPPVDITVLKSNDLTWEDRLKQVAITASCSKIIIDNDQILEEPFYSYELGLNTFNRCSIEHPYINLPEPNTIAVYIDLSGSIFSCPEVLSKFLDQINQIAECVGNLLLVPFDDGPTGVFMFNMSELNEPLGSLLLKHKEQYLVGGGGTDVIPLFKEFFNAFENYKVNIDINNICMLVVLTDLYLESVKKELEPYNSSGVIPTLWVVPKDDYKNDNQVNFGEILILD